MSFNLEISNIYETLEKIEKVSKRTEKENLLKTLSQSEIAKNIFRLAYEPLISFGTTQTEKELKNKEIDQNDYEKNYFCFINLLDEFQKRNITGNEAIFKFKDLLSNCDYYEKKWFTRILNRNLKIGLAENTILKVWPKLINQWKVMLADEYEDNKNHVYYPLYAEPKLDGYRFEILIKDKTIKLFNRSGAEYPHIADILLTKTHLIKFNNHVFSCEILGKDWNETSSLLRKKYLTKEDIKTLKGFTVNIFDCVSLKDFLSGNCKIPFSTRRRFLEIYLQNDDNIKLIKNKLINNENELEEYFKTCLSDGYEGIMLKLSNGSYETKRSRNWLKYKPFKTIDCKIIGFEEGDDKNKNKLGAFVCQIENNEIIKCGGGLSDIQREEFWKNKENLLNKTIEVKIQDDLVSKARFPVFIRFRDDK